MSNNVGPIQQTRHNSHMYVRLNLGHLFYNVSTVNTHGIFLPIIPIIQKILDVC